MTSAEVAAADVEKGKPLEHRGALWGQNCKSNWVQFQSDFTVRPSSNEMEKLIETNYKRRELIQMQGSH